MQRSLEEHSNYSSKAHELIRSSNFEISEDLDKL